MYIESHIIEDRQDVPELSVWVQPPVDIAVAKNLAVEQSPAEVRTPSSACLRCAYNAYAQNLGCVNDFAFCPYLAR